MRWRIALSSAAAVGLAAAGFAAPAQADLTTHCEGVAEDVTVPNDLVVPEGASCDLTNVTIEGNVTVQSGADFIGDGVTITGQLDVEDDAYADTVGSEVDGNVNLNSAYGVYLEGGAVNNAYAEDSGFLYSVETEHGNVLDSVNGETYLESSTVGNIATDGDIITDVYDTWVSGAFQVYNAEQGSVLCSSEVDGNAILQNNGGIIQIGADEPLGGCDTSYVGGNLNVSENTADSFISDTIVGGNLNCMNNDPAPVGENNRVRGQQLNQCEDMAAPESASTMSAQESVEQVESRKQAILDKIEARTAEGEEKADAAGTADIGN